MEIISDTAAVSMGYVVLPSVRRVTISINIHIMFVGHQNAG